MINKNVRNIYRHFLHSNLLEYVPHISIFIIIFIFSYKNILSRDFGGDFIAYFLPHYRFILNEIKSNGIPFWYPYAYNGLPELFKSELAIFHPVTLLVFIADLLVNKGNSLNITGNLFEVAWFSFLVFGAVGAYEFIYRIFNTGKFSALFGAICFALNPLMLPTMNTNVFLGIAALPWAMLFTANYVDNPNKRNLIFVILGNYLIFSAGYPYFYVYFLCLQLAYLIFNNYKRLISYIVLITLTVMASAFFLFPNIHIYSQSVRDNSRSEQDLQLFTSNIPTRIVNILNPMPYGKSFSEIDPSSVFTSNGVSWGTFPLIFLVIGIFTIGNNKKNYWLISAFLIAFIYSFGGYFFTAQFFSSFIPIIDKFRSHSISLVISMFTGAVFISIGVESTIKGIRVHGIEKVFTAIFLAFYLSLSFIPVFCPKCTDGNLPQILSLARTSFLLFTSLVLYYLSSKFRTNKFLLIGIVILLVEYHFYFLNLNGHFLDTKYSNFYRSNNLIPNSSLDTNLYRVYFDNNQFSYNTGLNMTHSYAGYETVPYKGWYGLQERYGFNKSLRLSNVKYMITTNPNWSAQNQDASIIKSITPAENYGETYISTVPGLPYLSSKSTNTHYVYEISKYQNRIFIPDKVFGCLQDCDIKENLPQEVVLKNQTDINFLENPLQTEVDYKIVNHSPNKLQLSISTPKPTFLVISETWDEGWTLKINGDTKKLFKVSNLFRGIYIPAGEKINVEMSYFPPMLLLGSFITIIGIMIIFIILFNFKKIEKFL